MKTATGARRDTHAAIVSFDAVVRAIDTAKAADAVCVEAYARAAAAPPDLAAYANLMAIDARDRAAHAWKRASWAADHVG